jgi:hypothetical protein
MCLVPVFRKSPPVTCGGLAFMLHFSFTLIYHYSEKVQTSKTNKVNWISKLYRNLTSSLIA